MLLGVEDSYGTAKARRNTIDALEKTRKSVGETGNTPDNWALYHPLIQYLLVFGELLTDLDDASAKLISKGAKNNHKWFQIQPGQITIHFPTTQECAERMKKNHEKKIIALFPKSDPITLLPEKDGLRIKIGSGKGETITLRYVNNTKIMKRFDEALLKAAGNPKAKQPHFTYDRKTNRFVADSSKMGALTASHLIREFTKE